MRRLGILKVREQDARFLAFMAVFTGLVFLLYREEYVGPSLAPLTLWTAKVTVLLLHWLGVEAVQAATVISHTEGFAYEVAYICVGVLPVAFFSAAVLAYPAALVHRLVGVTIGLPALLVLNFSRLVHLFYVGVHDRADFELWHADLWPTIMRLSVIGLWLAWACWAERRSTRLASHANSPSPLLEGEGVGEGEPLHPETKLPAPAPIASLQGSCPQAVGSNPHSFQHFRLTDWSPSVRFLWNLGFVKFRGDVKNTGLPVSPS
jgi:exosortase/archaeosortase family protein